MGKREKKANGHDKNYGIRVMSYALFAGFNGMETTVIAFLSYYMTDSVFLAAGVTGAIIACAKVFDGVSDVVAGYLIDRTHTKWGKARPYSLFAVLMWVGIILLFSVPQSFSMPVKCIYLFVIYVLTDSVFRTLALTSDPVHYRYGFNQKEQLDSIAIWGTCGGLIGLVAGIVIPALVASFQGRENGWTIIMVMLAVPAMIGSLMKFFFVPEIHNEGDVAEREKIHIKEAFKIIFKNKYLLSVALVQVLLIVLQSMGSIQTYYFTYIIGDLSLLAVASSFSLASIFVTPFYSVIAGKIGKRKMVLTFLAIGTAASVLAIFVSTSYIALGILTTIRMIGLISFNMVVNLFLIDCMKYTEWKEGVRAEGILSAITSLAQKLGAASALLLSGVVLQAFGYDGSQAVQVKGALDAIYGMYIILPIVLMAVAFIILYFYKLEGKLPQIEAELAERKGVAND